MSRARKGSRRFALCIESGEYPASLERLKLYELVPDADAEAHKQLRIVDESGEDYLYPSGYFKLVTLSPSLRRHVVGRPGRATKRVASIRSVRRTPPV
jgi:hypothetical protein